MSIFAWLLLALALGIAITLLLLWAGEEESMAAELEAAETGSERGYPVALSGESHYQRAIALISEGDTATIWHEPDNPHDEDALAVFARGRKIGYIPRDSWLHRALLREGKGVTASIVDVPRGEEFIGVVILVTLEGRPVETRTFAP